MLPRLDLCCTDPAQRLITAGLDGLDRDLFDLWGLYGMLAGLVWSVLEGLCGDSFGVVVWLVFLLFLGLFL